MKKNLKEFTKYLHVDDKKSCLLPILCHFCSKINPTTPKTADFELSSMTEVLVSLHKN